MVTVATYLYFLKWIDGCFWSGLFAHRLACPLCSSTSLVKFRILFRRMAVAWLQNERKREGNGTLFGKKTTTTAVLFDHVTIFLIHRTPRSDKLFLKIIYLIKQSDVFVCRLLRWSFSGKNKWSSPIRSCLAENC